MEKPQWQIMILDDGSESYQKLCHYLRHKKSVFIPYLGKNDHPATIDGVEIITLSEPQGDYIDSLFIKDFTSLGWAKEGEAPFLFQEVSPMRLQKEHHFYEYETLAFTNCEVENGSNTLFGYNHKNYSFF